MTHSILQWYLPGYLLLYLLVSFVLPSLRVYKNTGINPLTFDSSDTVHDFVGLWMKVVTALLVLVICCYSFTPQFYKYLLPFWYVTHPFINAAGLVLIHLSLLWIVLAQYQMRNSWRIGIDEKNKTALVTNGLFQYSRNPVFAGMLASVAGIFLLLPNAFSLLCLISSYLLIQVQIRLEEDFLQKQHGAIYLTYKQKVRRLL